MHPAKATHRNRIGQMISGTGSGSRNIRRQAWEEEEMEEQASVGQDRILEGSCF